MKKISLFLCFAFLLCFVFSLTAFASEGNNVVDVDNRVDIEHLEHLQLGVTYYYTYMPVLEETVEDVNNTAVNAFSVRNAGISSGNSVVFSATSYCSDSYSATSSFEQTIFRVGPSYNGCFGLLNFGATCAPDELVPGQLYTFSFNLSKELLDVSEFVANGFGHDYVLMIMPNSSYLEIYHLHVYDNACDSDCNECGHVREVVHSYDYDCSSKCNDCDYERDASHFYDNDCDPDCNVCGMKRQTSHQYNGFNDDFCNLCGYERFNLFSGLNLFSGFVISVVVEFALFITDSPLLLIAVVAIPLIALGIGILCRLFDQRV